MIGGVLFGCFPHPEEDLDQFTRIFASFDENGDTSNFINSITNVTTIDPNHGLIKLSFNSPEIAKFVRGKFSVGSFSRFRFNGDSNVLERAHLTDPLHHPVTFELSLSYDPDNTFLAPTARSPNQIIGFVPLDLSNSSGRCDVVVHEKVALLERHFPSNMRPLWSIERPKIRVDRNKSAEPPLVNRARIQSLMDTLGLRVMVLYTPGADGVNHTKIKRSQSGYLQSSQDPTRSHILDANFFKAKDRAVEHLISLAIEITASRAESPLNQLDVRGLSSDLTNEVIIPVFRSVFNGPFNYFFRKHEGVLRITGRGDAIDIFDDNAKNSLLVKRLSAINAIAYGSIHTEAYRPVNMGSTLDEARNELQELRDEYFEKKNRREPPLSQHLRSS